MRRRPQRILIFRLSDRIASSYAEPVCLRRSRRTMPPAIRPGASQTGADAGHVTLVRLTSPAFCARTDQSEATPMLPAAGMAKATNPPTNSARGRLTRAPRRTHTNQRVTTDVSHAARANHWPFYPQFRPCSSHPLPQRSRGICQEGRRNHTILISKIHDLRIRIAIGSVRPSNKRVCRGKGGRMSEQVKKFDH